MARGADVLVIGAGSAGCVIAARLSQDLARRVTLVEAGGPADDPDIADPLKWPMLGGRPFDYAYRTVPQPGTAGRVHDWPRGKVPGGSSCLNAMAHVRGHRHDVDAWAASGGPAWSWEGLLPGFIAAEASARGTPLRGRDGPLPVHLPDEDELHPVVRAWMAAGLALGVPWLGDHNDGRLCGVAPNSLNIRNGRRVTLADAYLTPEVLARPNLRLMTGTRVERLVLAGSRVTGAETSAGPVRAGQVVLAAGAIDSPLLLMRSGIGDPAVLARAGIACRHALPGVGRNLMDHMLVLGNVWRSPRPLPPSRLQHSESLMYLDSADVTRGAAVPDVVLACVAAPSVAPGLAAPDYGTAWTILCGATHPASRGSVEPTGPGSDDPPRIDPRYLEAPEDRAAMVRAVTLARQVALAPELAEWRAEEVHPGPGVEDEAGLAAFVERAACTHHHPAGSCRMGRDEGAVTAPDLAVRGLSGVSVVDASVLPRLTSGPINAAVVAIAETWSAGRFG